MLLRSGSCAEISPNPVSRELTPAGTSAHRQLFAQVDFRREIRPIESAEERSWAVPHARFFVTRTFVGHSLSRRHLGYEVLAAANVSGIFPAHAFFQFARHAGMGLGAAE